MGGRSVGRSGGGEAAAAAAVVAVVVVVVAAVVAAVTVPTTQRPSWSLQRSESPWSDALVMVMDEPRSRAGSPRKPWMEERDKSVCCSAHFASFSSSTSRPSPP